MKKKKINNNKNNDKKKKGGDVQPWKWKQQFLNFNQGGKVKKTRKRI